LSASKREKRQEEELKKLERNEHSFEAHVTKWPDLEAEVNFYIKGYRNNRILMSTKVIIFNL